MTAIRSNTLRAVIAADAAACGIGGAALVLDAAFLAPIAGVPEATLQPLGVFLIVYAAALAWLATRAELPRAVVWTLVGVNLAWTAESLLAPALGWAQPASVGLALIILQALGALIVADLQFLTLRRARLAALPPL
jgi:hypothetical protein